MTKDKKSTLRYMAVLTLAAVAIGTGGAILVPAATAGIAGGTIGYVVCNLYLAWQVIREND